MVQKSPVRKNLKNNNTEHFFFFVPANSADGDRGQTCLTNAIGSFPGAIVQYSLHNLFD
jgi:hypothetical protein